MIINIQSVYVTDACSNIFQASDKELIWVIRIGIFGVGALATVLALTIKSIYSLWALCSDLVYVILFPQLLCAIYMPFANTYGSLSAYIIGVVLRLGGGEPLIGLTAFIKYPLYDEAAKRQLFPFRSLAMAVSLLTLIIVSYLTKMLFKEGRLSNKFDFLRVFCTDSMDLEGFALRNNPTKYSQEVEEKDESKQL